MQTQKDDLFNAVDAAVGLQTEKFLYELGVIQNQLKEIIEILKEAGKC